LTDELQQSVPRHEVCEAAIDRAIVRRQNEGTVRHAARLAGVMCLYLAVLGPVAFGIRIMLVERPIEATSFILASLLMVLVVLGTFTVTLLGHLLLRCIRQTRNVASWMGIVGIPVLTGLLVLASIPMLVAATTGELQPALTIVNVTGPAAVLGMLMMPVVALLADREQRKVEPWQALVLTEP
jgi:cytochrome bd-type quinol oxidase subunit 2